LAKRRDVIDVDVQALPDHDRDPRSRCRIEVGTSTLHPR
jgi:hypothetical protein